MSRHGWFVGSFKSSALVMAIASMTSLAGCRPAETPPPPATGIVSDHDHDHDGHDHDHAGHDHEGSINVDELPTITAAPPLESFKQGVEQLIVVRDVIAKGFADDNIDSIHDQLHDVAGLLGQLEDMIPTTEMPAEAKQQMMQAIETLFEAYGEIDAKLHGDTGKEYSDVSAEINSAIDTLVKDSPAK